MLSALATLIAFTGPTQPPARTAEAEQAFYETHTGPFGGRLSRWRRRVRAGFRQLMARTTVAKRSAVESRSSKGDIRRIAASGRQSLADRERTPCRQC